MAEEDVNVKLRLDTKGAKGELNSFTRDAKQSSSKVSDQIRGSVKSGLALGGLGAFGAGGLRGATDAGVSSIIGEAFGGVGLDLERSLLGDLSLEAAADLEARESVIRNFARVTAQLGEAPPEAKNLFTQSRAFALEQRKGADIINRSEDFRTPLGEVSEDAMTRILGAIKSGFERLFEIGQGLRGGK